jgi:hypothetical protein
MSLTSGNRVFASQAVFRDFSQLSLGLLVTIEAGLGALIPGNYPARVSYAPVSCIMLLRLDLKVKEKEINLPSAYRNAPISFRPELKLSPEGQITRFAAESNLRRIIFTARLP